MATSIARINNLGYSSVAKISNQFIAEETALTRQFVENAPPISDSVIPVPTQTYIPEQPTQSSTGARLAPIHIATSQGTQTFGYGSTKSSQTDALKMSHTGTSPEMRAEIYPTNRTKPNRSVLEGVSLILGDVEPTSGVVPYRTDMASQTEWVNSREQGFFKRDIMFGKTQASAEYQGGGIDYSDGRNTYFREGMAVQTAITKPPSGKNIKGMPRQAQRFFENPQDRFGTVTGTPTRQLSSNDRTEREASVFGFHHTPKREMEPKRQFSEDSANIMERLQAVQLE
jgi:hypothetical protein